MAAVLSSMWALSSRSGIFSGVSGGGVARVVSACKFDASDAVHTVGDIDPDDPSNMDFFFTFDVSQLGVQSVCVNDFAFKNILVMSATLDTSQFEMLTLNDFAL